MRGSYVLDDVTTSSSSLAPKIQAKYIVHLSFCPESSLWYASSGFGVQHLRENARHQASPIDSPPKDNGIRMVSIPVGLRIYRFVGYTVLSGISSRLEFPADLSRLTLS